MAGNGPPLGLGNMMKRSRLDPEAATITWQHLGTWSYNLREILYMQFAHKG
jgi:hypothetical protein